MKADRVRKTLRNKIEILRAELRDKEDKILRLEAQLIGVSLRIEKETSRHG
jgi:hypothetical protein